MTYNNPYGSYKGQPYYGNAQPYYGGAGPMQPAVFPQATPSPTFPPQTGTAGPSFPPAGMMITSPTGGIQVPGMLPAEQSYIENILRLNKGKLVTVYATFENNSEWNAKVFSGIIEAAGRDHLILSDPQTGKRLLLPMIYLDYVTFDEEIEYDYPYGAAPDISTYPPR